MSASASENGEMSVNMETVKTGCSEANSPPSLQVSECTGNHNIIPTMTEVAMAISDGADVAATCPEQAIVGQMNHASLTDTQTHSESVGQKARGNENHVNRRRSLHHPKQQQQPKPPKRRNTMNSGFKHPMSGKRRRRANSESDSVLPTNFLLGGNICDPLNLNSLLDEEVNRALNAETPKSSPLPAKNRDPVEIIIPRDITDPLNLNSGMGDRGFLMSPFKKKRHRHRHHGGGGGGGGISATHLDLLESAKSSEAKTTASTLPPVPDVPKGTSTLSTIPGDSHDHKESNSSNCEERMTTSVSAPQARGAEDSASAASGGQSHHSSKRKRKRHAGKAEPPVVPSTLIRKPGSAERCHSQAFHTPKSGPRSGGQQQQSHGQHKRQQQQQQQQKFEYGNYSKYYGYRNPGTSEDPRVQMLRPEWFQGKEVLDLGCNSGHLTLYIAKMLRPARILGLDIDSGLIRAARKNIRHYLSEQQTQEARRATQEEKKSTKRESNDNEHLQGRKTQTVKQEQDRDSDRESRAENGKADGAAQGESGSAEAVKDSVSSCHTDDCHTGDRELRGQGCEAEETKKEDCGAPPAGHPFPVSLQITRGPIAAPLVTETPTAPPGEFPHNVSFIKANYVLENDHLLLTQRPEYDVILCLSVTKWIHLNWGDSGLKRLFQRVYRHLNPGGLFILEPQPWQSYLKRKRLSENIFRNYQSIRLKPDNFSTYLTSEVGFSSYELIGTPTCTARGFQRPIYLFHK